MASAGGEIVCAVRLWLQRSWTFTRCFVSFQIGIRDGEAQGSAMDACMSCMLGSSAGQTLHTLAESGVSNPWLVGTCWLSSTRPRLASEMMAAAAADKEAECHCELQPLDLAALTG
jgi:hypothetical protein